MIVVHFFLRKTKDRTWLMADSSATETLEPAFGQPVAMFAVEPSARRRSSWIRRAKASLEPLYPGARMDVLLPTDARPAKTQVFDIAITPAAGDAAPEGLMTKLKGLIK